MVLRMIPIAWVVLGMEKVTKVPVLTIICESLLDTTMTLEVETSQDGSIYIIPLGTRLVADSIVKYKVASTDALANTLTRIPLNEVQHGEYLVTAVSHFRCVCYQGVAIKLVEDLMPPSLTLAKVSINYSEPIIATSSKDGILFLVDELTPAKIHYIRSCRFLIDSSMVKANVPIELTTVDIEGDYRLFAIDNYGCHSIPHKITVWPVGINQSHSDENRLSIYPNPTDELLTIHLQKQGDPFI
jgi:hypothetical protein